jgi:4-hydroxy-tetrahydrodipicolinate synthase
MALTAETLRGVYCFVPMPWDENYHLDEEVLRHDLAYLCGTGISGLYTTDTSGEFYTLDFDEFCRFVDIVMDTVKPTGLPLQIGCTWTDTRGALRRAEYAARQGADAIRFAFPYWQKLTTEECLRFMEEMAAACGPVPLVHYNNPCSKVVFGVEEYRQVVRRVPTLIGTKLPLHDPIAIAELIDKVPELSHFVGEYVFAPSMAAGARGLYSFLAATNPRLTMEWYASCVQGDWNRAIEIQTMVNRWKVNVKMRWSCASDAAVNKLDAIVNPNFHCHVRVRPPYTSGTTKDVEFARRWAAENMPEMLQL